MEPVSPEPFTSYPHDGHRLLGPVRGANCRHEYGLRHQQVTGQTNCAYCGISLVDTYEHWLWPKTCKTHPSDSLAFRSRAIPMLWQVTTD